MFTRMQDGTAEDWAVIGAAHQEHFKKTPETLLNMLRSLEEVSVGFACNQLQHSLMTGTARQMVIHHAHSLHKRIDDCRAAELKPPFFQVSRYLL